MRNPWGLEIWKGTWSDSDTAHWTEDAKKALNHTSLMNDGVFFMSLSDYKEMIFGTTIGLYGWKLTRMDAVWNRKNGMDLYSFRWKF